IRWRTADEGWFTLNSDGSLYSHNDRAAAGGLIRDCEGKFISSYAVNLSSCSIMWADLRGIIEGMRLAWDKGIMKFCIQTNSRAVVAILEEAVSRSHWHTSLVEQFHTLRNQDWDVTIHYIYRKATNAADYMANFGHELDLRSHVFSSPIDSLLYRLRYDLIGVCLPRFVNTTF
ncbi:Putative ribonuclease H protein At1g65750, partial [Linum perenne]